VRTTPSCLDSYQKLGRMGKQILKKILGAVGGPPRVVACLFAVSLLGGCQTDLAEPLQSGRVLAWHGLQGRWVGPVVPTEPACGPPTHGTMTIGKKGFGFDPFQSTAVIHGEVDNDRHLSGSLVRQGAEHQNLSVAFEGSAERPDAIAGSLQSGRCRWTVALHRG
jgi:hypothetical protein